MKRILTVRKHPPRTLFGQIERTFGGDVTEADITAGFENGILKVSVPKRSKSEG